MKKLFILFALFPIVISGQYISDSTLTAQILKTKNPSSSSQIIINRIDSIRTKYEKEFLIAKSQTNKEELLSEYLNYLKELIDGDGDLFVKQYAALNLPFIEFNGLKVPPELLNKAYELLPPDDQMWALGHIKLSIVLFLGTRTNILTGEYLKAKNLTFSELNEVEKQEYNTLQFNTRLELSKKLYEENPIELVKAYVLVDIIDVLDLYKKQDEIGNYYNELVKNFSKIKRNFIEDAIIEYSPKTFNKIGKKFPQFSYRDMINGEVIELSKMKGKLCLIQFWATWCGNCIAEVPMLMQIYEKYKKQDNFEMISISLDKEISDAIKYIEGNKVLPWHNIFIEKGFNSDLAKDLGLTSLPRLILVNEDGIIIENSIDGVNVESILETYLKRN